MFMFVEGPRVGWILAAEHPAAVSTNPVSAVQRSHSHTAPGERRSHSSCHIRTHTGTITFLFKTVLVLPNMLRLEWFPEFIIWQLSLI